MNQKNVSSLWKFYQTYFHNLHFRITRIEFNNRKISQTHSHNIYSKISGLVRRFSGRRNCPPAVHCCCIIPSTEFKLSCVIDWDKGFPGGSEDKCLPGMRETQVRSLGWEVPLEKEMATHSSTLAWRIPWREEPSRLQSMGLQRVGNDWATSLHFKECRGKRSLSFSPLWEFQTPNLHFESPRPLSPPWGPWTSYQSA